jgi:tetratricopeptide (TPR) repeat protein
LSLDSYLCLQFPLFPDFPADGIHNDRRSTVATSMLSPELLDSSLDEIKSSIYSDNTARALSLIRWLLRSGMPISPEACTVFIQVFSAAIPDYPCSLVNASMLEQQSLLDDVIALLEQLDCPALLIDVEILDYRLHEACGRYAEARARVRRMLDRQLEPFNRARLINDYGFEYQLEGNHAIARPFFADALHRFEKLEDDKEIANVRANLLTCEFRVGDDCDKLDLLPRVLETHSALHRNRDWRIRKTMLLLAARAEAQERIPVAIAWARRAVRASAGVNTRMHETDAQYLKKLRRKRNRRKHQAAAG